jgi:hypothetical protein
MESKLQNILLIIIIILLIAGGIGMFFQQKEIRNLKSSVVGVVPSGQMQKTQDGKIATQDSLPANVSENIKEAYDKAAVTENIVNGKLASTNGDSLILDVISAKDGKKIASFTVKTTTNTKITKTELSGTPKRTDIKLSDLRVGDHISAASKEPLNGKTEFEAVSVDLALSPPAPKM